MKILAVSKAIVVNAEGKILLLRRSADDDRRPSQWDIPGGHVDEGENPVQAAARETAEEAGISVEAEDMVLVYAMTQVPREGESVTWLFHRVHIDQADVRLSHEHSDYAWATISDALDMITYERQRLPLQYVMDNDLLGATVA